MAGKKQKQIAEYLNNLEPGAGSIYLGALAVLENNKNPDRISQSAHSIREVVNVITRKIDSSREKQENVKKVGLKKKLEKLESPIGAPTSKNISLSTKLGNLHGEFVALVHHGKSLPPLKQYLKKIKEFELLISSLIKPFFQSINEIDSILSKHKPTKKEIKRILELFNKDLESNRYFYENAKSNWLQILIDKDMFLEPNKIEETDRQSSIKPWFESLYLSRIAKDEPQKVCDVILKCNIPRKEIGKYSHVLSDFVSAALKMPLNQASEISKLAIKKNWVRTGFIPKLHLNLAELMAYLAKNGNITDSLQLAKKLFFVRLRKFPSNSSISIGNLSLDSGPYEEIESVTDYYSFEHNMQTHLLEVGKIYPKETIQFLVELLVLIIKLDNNSKKFREIYADNSYIWWPSIEDSSQNSRSDIKGMVITQLRKLLEYTNSNKPSIFRYSFQLIKKQNSSLFTRFLLFQCKLNPNAFKKDMEKLLIENFENYRVSREYYLCMEKVYPELSSKIKKDILDLISKGPDIEYLIRQNKKMGIIHTKNQIKNYEKNWSADKLRPIAKHLPTHKKQYEKLVREMGEHPYPGFSNYVKEIDSVGHVRGLNESMTISQVFKHAQSCKMSKKEFSIYDDGIGITFRNFVMKDPLEYSKNSKKILKLHPYFCYQFLASISHATGKEKKIDWKNIISLCDYVTDPKNEKFAKIQRSISENILLILNDGLKSNNFLAFTHRTTIWKILERIEQLKEESILNEYPLNNLDSYIITISSIKEKTLETVIHYNDWCNKKQKNVKKKMYPEVKKLLSRHIKIKNDDAIPSRSVFGRFYPYLYNLDKNWIEKNKSEIIVLQNMDLNDAFWDSYLYNEVYENSFVSLYSEFKNRIKSLENHVEVDRSTRDPNIRFITHIATACLLKIENGKRLLKLILKTSDEYYINCLIHSIAFDILKPLKESNAPNSELKFYKDLIQDSHLKGNKNLGECFAYSPFEREFSISFLSKILSKTKGEVEPMWLVLEELATYVKDFPKETLDCLEKFLRFYANTHEISRNQDVIKQILQEAHLNKDTLIKKKTKHIINLMGQIGFPEFGKLL